MYENHGFELLYSEKEQLNSTEVNRLLDVIKEFYNEVNQSIDKCTERYQKAVADILNTFPILVVKSIDNKNIYKLGNRQLNEINEIIEALIEYTNKFESVRYLRFLAEENRNVVFVGPNGAGKTTLLRRLKNDTKNAKIHYYPADRVLLVSDQFNPKRSYEAFISDFKSSYESATNIENDWRGTKIIEQFDYYINLLE